MESMQSIRTSIADAKGGVLLLMQEGTDEYGISDEWAEAMYLAYEMLVHVDEALDEAERAG